MSSENKTRLDAKLYELGLTKSRTTAAELIKEGKVKVNGRTITKPSFLVADSDTAEVTEQPEFVSRAGLKLKGAIEHFGIDLKDKRCIDIGASTGGFTDCMLRYGAVKVYAVDVGTAQLDDTLRADGRVISLERTDIRTAELEKADFISADVSFISLKLIIPSVCRLLNDGAGAVLLIKPQFEAGRKNIGKNGIVRDPKIHRAVCEDISAFAESAGLTVKGIIPSPIYGGDGNKEFLMYAVKRKES